MRQYFTLEYWIDDGWYVGRLRGVPGVFSQGQSLAELEENVRDAYRMMVGGEGAAPPPDAVSTGMAEGMTSTSILGQVERRRYHAIRKSRIAFAVLSEGSLGLRN